MNTEISNKRIALVGPKFFSYAESIASRINAHGIECQFIDERHDNSILTKILYRIGFHSKFESTKRRHLNSILENISNENITDVLLVDVEVIDRQFVSSLTGLGVRVHLYMWDSSRNKPSFLKYMDLLTSSASFDPEDCENYGMVYVPLFSEDVFSIYGSSDKSFRSRSVDISFCGTLHSNRASYLGELEKLAKRKGLNTKFYLYYHYKPLMIIKAIFQPVHLKFLPAVQYKSFSKRDIFLLFSGSKYVFDVPHPGQVGLTARTFEVLRAGSNLITFNKTVDTLPDSLRRRVILIDSIEDISNINFREFDVCDVPNATDDYFLSINRFVDQTLRLMNISLGS